MRIQAKLIMLILGIVLLLVAAAGVYVVFLSPVSKMELERGRLTVLSDALKDEQLKLARLPYTSIKQGSAAFQEVVERVNQAFTGLDGIVVLPKINKDVAEALDVILALKALGDQRVATLSRDYDQLVEDAKAINFFVENFVFSNFYDDKYLNPAKKDLARAAVPHLNRFMTDLSIVSGSLEASVSTVADQYKIIEGEIGKTRARAVATASIIAALIVALTIAFAIAFAKGVAKSVMAIERNIALLKEGDLTYRTKVKSRDEIGRLAGNLNLFLDGLSSALLRIKGISKVNVELKDELLGAVAEATGATTQIEASTASIADRIRDLDSRIEGSIGSIEEIVGNIGDLNAQIEGQSSMVEEATASVTEMLSSLDSMGRITERDRASAAELVRTAEQGRKVFEEASSRIAEIPQSVGAIREMASVIQGIASQTNLLAMNAAIEAAHAGDAGRGFAVVADEIRKLSEASTTSSREISDSIGEIVSKIDQATEASSGTSGAFAEIDDGIRGVAASMTEIYSGISEMRTGSEQILQAMVELRERSARVKEGSTAMEAGSSAIGTAMQELGRASREIAANVSEIGAGISDIGAAIKSVDGMALRVGAESVRLDGEVNLFKTLA
jgi:methyl-accepting chemotaxis protein